MSTGVNPSEIIPKQYIHAEQPRVEQVQPSPAAETELVDDIDADLQQALERVAQLQQMKQQREEQRNISRTQRPAVATVFDAGVTAGCIGTGGVPLPEKRSTTSSNKTTIAIRTSSVCSAANTKRTSTSYATA